MQSDKGRQRTSFGLELLDRASAHHVVALERQTVRGALTRAWMH